MRAILRLGKHGIFIRIKLWCWLYCASLYVTQWVAAKHATVGVLTAPKPVLVLKTHTLGTSKEFADCFNWDGCM